MHDHTDVSCAEGHSYSGGVLSCYGSFCIAPASETAKTRSSDLLCAGFEVLTAMERVPTDDDDRPRQEIRITGATVFVNPYRDEEEAERKAAEAARLKVL